MRIQFEISEEYATVALMYHLGLGIKINSKKSFRKELTCYFMMNGTQCLDDHESENEDYREQATALVNKYFK